MPRFRIRSKQFFLTYPECDVTKQEAFDYYTVKHNPELILVAHELHANGNSHLHCYLKFKAVQEYTEPDCFDLGNFHGNYQSCRSAKNVLKYCTKKDDYLANFDVDELLTGRTIEKSKVGKRLLEGEPLTKIVEEMPALVFGYKKLKGDVEEYKIDVKVDEREELPWELPNPWGKRMFVDLDLKKCHYWVYSKEPNRGKTTGFLEPIFESYRAVWKDQTEPYWSISRETEIIIFDEVKKGDFKAQKLNMMANGHAEFRVFQGGNIRLNSKPLILICSNFSIQEVFPFEFSLISSRFIEICVD